MDSEQYLLEPTYQPEWSDDNRSAAGGHTFQLRPGIMISLFGINLFDWRILNLSKWIGSSTTGIWLIASILPALLSTWWMDGVSSDYLLKVLLNAYLVNNVLIQALKVLCYACLVSQVVSLSDGCEDQRSEEGRSHLEKYFLAHGYQFATW